MLHCMCFTHGATGGHFQDHLFESSSRTISGRASWITAQEIFHENHRLLQHCRHSSRDHSGSVRSDSMAALPQEKRVGGSCRLRFRRKRLPGRFRFWRKGQSDRPPEGLFLLPGRASYRKALRSRSGASSFPRRVSAHVESHRSPGWSAAGRGFHRLRSVLPRELRHRPERLSLARLPDHLGLRRRKSHHDLS